MGGEYLVYEGKKKEERDMGSYVNRGKDSFESAAGSQIYIETKEHRCTIEEYTAG